MPTTDNRTSLRLASASRVVIADLPPGRAVRIDMDDDGLPVLSEVDAPTTGGGTTTPQPDREGASEW